MSKVAVVQRTRRPLLSVWLAAVVLGMLSIHTLAHQHHQPAATPIAGHHAAATSLAMEATRSATEANHVATDALWRTGAAAVSPVAATADQDPLTLLRPASSVPGEIAMLCAAMLLSAASGVLIAVRLRRRLLGRLVYRVSAHSPVRQVPADHGSTGPPYQWRFSVVRC